MVLLWNKLDNVSLSAFPVAFQFWKTFTPQILKYEIRPEHQQNFHFSFFHFVISTYLKSSEVISNKCQGQISPEYRMKYPILNVHNGHHFLKNLHPELRRMGKTPTPLCPRKMRNIFVCCPRIGLHKPTVRNSDTCTQRQNIFELSR